jgi:hypothetical protein
MPFTKYWSTNGEMKTSTASPITEVKDTFFTNVTSGTRNVDVAGYRSS